MPKKLSSLQIIILIVVVLILDQLTKYITKTEMALGQSIPVMGDFFRLTYVENPGMAFGLRIDNTWLFLGLSLFAAGLVFYYLYRLRNEAWPLQGAISLIAAGAIGNLSDRFMRGSVVDFLDFEFFDIPSFSVLGMQFSGITRWPVFNVADIAVSCGMAVLFLYIIIKGDPLNPRAGEQTQSEHVSQ